MKKLMKRKEEKISRFLYKGEKMKHGNEAESGFIKSRTACMKETKNKYRKLQCVIQPEKTKEQLQDYWSGAGKISHFLAVNIIHDPSKKHLYRPLMKINSQMDDLFHTAEEPGKDLKEMNLKLHRINQKILEKGMNIDDKFLSKIQDEVDIIAANETN